MTEYIEEDGRQRSRFEINAIFSPDIQFANFSFMCVFPKMDLILLSYCYHEQNSGLSK